MAMIDQNADRDMAPRTTARAGGSRPTAAGITRLPLLVAALLALLIVPSVLAQSAPIVSTEVGEVPSTGGRRPGPIGQNPAPVVRQPGVRPVAIQVEAAQIDAEIEALDIVAGVMQDPTGPFVVSWYEDRGWLGERDNIVMAGHVDYWNVGPAVFYNLGSLAEGDEIIVTGEDGSIFRYAVEWTRLYDNANAPLEEIVGATPNEALTLITCGGTFDTTSGEYLSRFVVRATRVADGG